MAYQEVSKQEKYYKYAECEEGQVLVDGGVYRGGREGKFGIQHVFKTEEEYIVLNSSGHLNWLLENRCNVGDFCKIVYEGKDVLESGKFSGKEAHKFSILVDDEKADLSVRGTKPPTSVSDELSVDDGVL